MISKNIVTERLILRNITLEDAQSIFQLWSDFENNKYMCDPVVSPEEVEEIIEDLDCSETNIVIATIKETGEIVGTCCFGPADDSNAWGFGYNLFKKFWGKGYATEIVQAVIAFGSILGIEDFISSCAIENVASGNVLQKNGMHIDGTSSFLNPISNIVYEEHIYKRHIPRS